MPDSKTVALFHTLARANAMPAAIGLDGLIVNMPLSKSSDISSVIIVLSSEMLFLPRSCPKTSLGEVERLDTRFIFLLVFPEIPRSLRFFCIVAAINSSHFSVI
ncbi:MAG: hypothetical protein ACD_79C00473G0009 [uncultured bacterium]|nr:MAG: hypothetical protein ACD_79C00473G0009 [uncultured bacterium]